MIAVVLLGHGSRAAGVSQAMAQVACALTAHLPNMLVRAAHRELCEPSLEQVVRELSVNGVERIVVLPFFLHQGLHMQEDIPRQIEALRREQPHLQLVCADHIGYDDRLVAILQDRVTAALGEDAR
jgi:sirohydrochlorin ferrochelatase